MNDITSRRVVAEPAIEICHEVVVTIFTFHFATKLSVQTDSKNPGKNNRTVAS